MNADQIAEICPAVQEAIAGAPDTCVTLEIEGDSDKWLQVAGNQINAAYPYDEHPEGKMKPLPLPPAAKIVDWKAHRFVTLECEELEPTALAQWIDAYFVALLSCPPGDYHVEITYEQL
jgi:hypothetical protein